MSSSQAFLSSPLLSQSLRRKSKFTFKHLHQLSQYSTTCPLRVIALIDLDAFYAQCELVRLGLPEDKPVAVQQWQGLIAINYPARKFGLGRHITATEAQKLCPDLVCVHVATWREGDTQWAYREDAANHISTHKVSLDPYRRESRRILQLIRNTLPAPPMQKVEKASVDEMFMDLSAQVHAILLERYPELAGPPPYDDPTEPLPRPPITALDWAKDAVVDLNEGETEEDDPDWDDVAILIGSEIVRGLREKVYAELKYTCSAGIARNKMLAKLGAGHKKPNAQTVVRNRAVQQFLNGFKFTKIRNLGGKLGDEAVALFDTDTVEGLMEVPLEQLKRLGDDTGQWLYNTIRGEDNSEVNPRTQIKSMLSAKSFRPSINTMDQGKHWLRIFVADIFSRCVEEGVLEHKRKPRTVNLHYRHGGQTRSKQAPIPQGKTLSEDILYELAKNLLAQIVADGRAWPCSNLSLSVGGFEDAVGGNRSIGGFLVRGEEAKAMLASERDTPDSDRGNEPTRATKRRRMDGRGIQNFFASREESKSEVEQSGSHDEAKADDEDEEVASRPATPDVMVDQRGRGDTTPIPFQLRDELPPPSNQAHPPLHQTDIDTYFCSRCQKKIPIFNQGEHEDEHMARDLQEQFQREERTAAPVPIPARSSGPKASGKVAQKGRGRPPGSASKRSEEKGQKKLQF